MAIIQDIGFSTEHKNQNPYYSLQSHDPIVELEKK